MQLEEHNKIFILCYESVSSGCNINCSKVCQEKVAVRRDLLYRHWECQSTRGSSVPWDTFFSSKTQTTAGWPLAQGGKPAEDSCHVLYPPNIGKSIIWTVTLSGWCCQAWKGLLQCDNWYLSVLGISLLARIGTAALLTVEAGLMCGNIRTGLVYCPVPSCNDQTQCCLWAVDSPSYSICMPHWPFCVS